VAVDEPFTVEIEFFQFLQPFEAMLSDLKAIENYNQYKESRVQVSREFYLTI
jgi:hypothetical protein